MADTAERCWAAAYEDVAQTSSKTVDMTGLNAWPTTAQINKFSKSPHMMLGASSSRRRQYAAKVGSLVRAIHNFAPAFDVFFQQQAFLATVVWGTCRFLIQAVALSIELCQKMHLALAQIIPSLTRVSRQAKLFETENTVLCVVTDYFKNTLLFILRVRAYFGQSNAWYKLERLRAPFSNELADALQALEGCAKRVAEEMDITAKEAQCREYAKKNQHRGESLVRFQHIEDMTREILDTGKKVEERVRSSDSRFTHRSDPISALPVLEWLASGVFLLETIPPPSPGTCNGLGSHQTWLKWEAGGCPNVLLVTGATGLGKSVYALEVTRRAKENRDRVVISHFFQASATELSTQARTFAISALWHLLQHSEVTERAEFSSVLLNFAPFLTTYPNVSSCGLEGLLDLVNKVLKLVKNLLLVVDGLDECSTDPNTFSRLTEYLLKLGEGPGAQVIIFARDQCLLDVSSVKSISKLQLDKALVKPDIKVFVEQRVKSTKRFSRLQQEIIDAIIAHSHCNFFLAWLLLEDLESADTIGRQREKMAQLADHIPDKYREMFDEINERLSPADRDRRNNIFRLLIASRGHPTAQSIAEALDGNDPFLEPAKSIIKLCRPFVKVLDNDMVVFVHNTAREFLLKYTVTLLESNIFIARKCLEALRETKYGDWKIPSQLLRKHILLGRAYAIAKDELLDDSAFYDYATLYFQDHITELKDPPQDIVRDLAAFLLNVEFVSWSEHLLDLKKQSGLANQMTVYTMLRDWTKKLSDPIRGQIPIADYWEKAHNRLSVVLADQSRDRILQYLPYVRNGNYFNNGGQSACDWAKAYKYKRMVVSGITDLLGSDSPVVLRSMADLLQEYFWQKRFVEVLPLLLRVVTGQRNLGDAGVTDLFTTLLLLGAAYHCLTRFDEALDVFKEAAMGVEDRLGKSDRRYLLISLYKGHTLEQQLRFEDASLLYNRVKDTLIPIVGSANGFTLMSQTAIGAIQRKRGQYQLAETNLLEGWGGRQKIFTIHVNVCLDAALQLALLYRDNQQGKTCLELLDDVSNSIVFKEDFERLCTAEHIRCLVGFDSRELDKPKLRLLQLIHKGSVEHRDWNNRELMWIRCTVSDVERFQGRNDQAEAQFTNLVQLIKQGDLSDEPEPPAQLRLAEKAVRLVRKAQILDADTLLRDNGLRWVREADFYVLGQGGPVTDTAVIAPIRFKSSRK